MLYGQEHFWHVNLPLVGFHSCGFAVLPQSWVHIDFPEFCEVVACLQTSFVPQSITIRLATTYMYVIIGVSQWVIPLKPTLLVVGCKYFFYLFFLPSLVEKWHLLATWGKLCLSFLCCIILTSKWFSTFNFLHNYRSKFCGNGKEPEWTMHSCVTP